MSMCLKLLDEKERLNVLHHGETDRQTDRGYEWVFSCLLMTLSMQLQTRESLWDHHSHTRWFGLAALRPLAAVRRWWISGSHFWPDYISIAALLSHYSVIIQGTRICSQLSFLWWWHFLDFAASPKSFIKLLCFIFCGRIVFSFSFHHAALLQKKSSIFCVNQRKSYR